MEHPTHIAIKQAGSTKGHAAALNFNNNLSVSIGPGGEATIDAAAGGGGGSVNFSAGTLSSNRTNITFSNSNGVSWGLNTNGVLTATVATNYQSSGPYLTTAALSQDSSRYAGTNGSITGGSITVNTSGVSVNLPAYLTTAMQSNATTISNIKVSAGTLSSNRSDLTFADSNGVSFGFNTNGVVTATVATNYQSQGAYLTTAALSQDSSKYAGINGSITGGSITVNTSGVSVNLPAYLTTAMQSNAATISNIKVSAGGNSQLRSDIAFLNSNNISFTLNATGGGIAANYVFGISAGTTNRSNLNAVSFSNANGVSFGIGSDAANLFQTITASVKTDYAGTNASITGGSLTVNTSGISINIAPVGGITNINVSAGTLSNNLSALTFSDSGGVSWGLNTNGVLTATVATNYQSSGAYLTTAMASNAATISNVKISAGTLSANRSDLTFTDSGGVSWGLNTNGVLTATVATNYQSSGAYLTTAALSAQTSNFAGTNTSLLTTTGTDPVLTLNTTGLTLAYPKWITTYVNDLTSDRAGVNGSVATTAGTDLALTLNTSGATIGYPKWITTAPLSSAMMSLFANRDMLIDDNSTTMSCGTSVLQVVPFILPHAISIGFVRIPVSMSLVSTEISGTSANTTFTYNRSYSDAICIMTQNVGASSLSLANLVSTFASWVFQWSFTAGAQGSRYTITQNVTYPVSGTTSAFQGNSAQSSANIGYSTNLLTNFTGLRFYDIPFAASLSAGNYWLVLGRSTNSASNAGPAAGGASMAMSTIGVSHSNIVFGPMGGATTSSVQLMPGLGSWSTNAAVSSTASIQLASVSAQSSSPLAYFQMLRFA